MGDLWVNNLGVGPFVVALGAILLPVQVFLCFKIKSRAVKLRPVAVCGVLAATFMLMAFTRTDWAVLGYIILAFYAVTLAGVCLLGWLSISGLVG